jgi:segregation and condensation protein A
MDYQVNLDDTFHGPLDLLLYLVKRDEIDVLDIPIARVAEQFLGYLNVLQWIDVEQAGDFLVMAATLMEIKSKMLLPRVDEPEEEAEDPRLDLVRQLIEYKKYKEAAALLEARAEEQSFRVPRQPRPAPALDPAQEPLRQAELWDLVSAFGRLMQETLSQQAQQIVVDHTPMHVYMEEIVQRLGEAPAVPFSALFTPPHHRARLVGMFLAVLELIKRSVITAEQPEAFGDILLSLHPESDQPTSLALNGEG